MTDEERDIITSFIARVSGAARPAPSAGSVPTAIQALPAVDPEADRLIADLFQRYPEARYRLTQTAFVQEHALTEAHSRLAQLQTELDQARAAPTRPAPQPSGGGFFHSVFGGGQNPPPATPSPFQPQPYQAYPAQAAPSYAAPPQYSPPQYAAPQGMFQRSGSGFLGSALTTAAGVAGGMVAGNALMSLFEGPRGFGGGLGGFGGGGYGMEPGFAPSPWDSPAPDAQVTGSAWDSATETSQPAGWDQGSDPNAGGGADQGGAWDQGGNDGGGNDGSWDQGGNNNTGSF